MTRYSFRVKYPLKILIVIKLNKRCVLSLGV